jgi:hypothetical protein
MKKIITTAFIILLPFFSYAQEKTDNNLIPIIEDLSSYSVVVDGTEVQYFTDIKLNIKTGRIKIIDTQDYSVKYIETITSFNLEDIDNESVAYEIIKSEVEDEFLINFEISTLNNSVEYSEVVFENGKEYTRVSDSNSSDLIRLSANGKAMSRELAQKYADSWMEFLGIVEAKKIKY